MAKVFAQMRLIAGALALAFVVATAMPAARAAAELGQPDRRGGERAATARSSSR